ncbi:MAG TPA: hypothetical protein VJ552_05320 [Sediminibacterium sp.]|nr:hypothetical protein [Sediminibacterium sp.]
MAGNNNEYLIPLGADLSPLISSLREGRATINKLSTSSQEAGKNIQQAFAGAVSMQKSVTAEVINSNRAMKEEAQQAIQLGNVFKQLAESASKATDSEKLKKYSDEFKKLADLTQKGLRVNLKDEEIAVLNTLLSATKNEMEQLAAVTTVLKTKLDTLDPRSEEWDQLNQAITLSEKVIQDFGQAEDGLEKKSISLKSQLRQLKQELALMEEQGLEGTKAFEDMQIAAGQLEDQLGDTQARVKALASDTKYIDAAIQAATALTAGFGLAQGASALFGSENEELAKVLNKVQGAMIVLNSLQQIQNLLQKQNILAILTSRSAMVADTVATEVHTGAVVADSVATNVATTATKGFTAALAANPLGLVLVALGAVIAAVSVFTSATEDAATAQEELNKKQLEFADISKSTELAYIERTNQLLIAESKARGDSEAKTQQIELSSQRQRVKALERYYESVKGMADKELEAEQALKDEKVKLRVLELNFTTENKKKQQELSKKFHDEELKKEEAYQQAIDAVRKKYRDVTISNIVSERERSKKEAAARANDEIAEIDKLLDAQRKAGKLSAELETAANGAKTQIRSRYIADVLKIDIDFYQQQEQLLKSAQEAINGVSQTESERGISDITKRYEQLIAGINESNKKLLQQSSLSDKDKAVIEANNNAIIDLNSAMDKEILRLKQNFAFEKLKIEEKLALDTIDLQKFTGLSEETIRKVKEEQRIAITKQYGQKRLDLLKSQLVQEKAVTKDQFDALTDKKNIDGAAASGKDIFSYLGLSDKLSPETKEKILGAIKDARTEIKVATPIETDLFKALGIDEVKVRKWTEAVSALGAVWKSTFESMLIPINNLVEARKRAVEEISNDIDELENQLEREQEAREKGYANNVDLLNKEIAEKKLKREEELKNLEEAQKKQRTLQRLQIISDTFAQTNNLVTASSEIYKFMAPLGPIGVGIAIATITAMIGSFVAAKISALKAVNDEANAPKFDKGGGLVLEGPDHSQGGMDVVEKRTGKTKANVRGGEYMYVFRHTNAKQYEGLFDMINSDPDGNINSLLREIGGIHIIEDAPNKIMPAVNAKQQADDELRQAIILSADNSKELSEIKRELKEFKDAWNEEPRVIDYGDYVEITIGNIRKTVKKHKS